MTNTIALESIDLERMIRLGHNKRLTDLENKDSTSSAAITVSKIIKTCNQLQKNTTAVSEEEHRRRKKRSW